MLASVGISAVDELGAAANLEAELDDPDFDAVREQARAAWDTQLSKIAVEGGTEAQQRVFYSALYHACISHPEQAEAVVAQSRRVSARSTTASVSSLTPSSNPLSRP